MKLIISILINFSIFVAWLVSSSFMFLGFAGVENLQYWRLIYVALLFFQTFSAIILIFVCNTWIKSKPS